MADSSKLLQHKWHCKYWYPSNKKPGTEEISAYTGSIQKSDGQYVYESDPTESKAYMFVRFTVNGDLATGTWHENTSPSGEFRGAIYGGAFQALVDDSGDKIDGKWVGIGQENGKRQIYTGRWLFEKAE